MLSLNTQNIDHKIKLAKYKLILCIVIVAHVRQYVHTIASAAEWKMRLSWNYDYELIDDFHSSVLLIFLPLCIVLLWHLICWESQEKENSAKQNWIYSLNMCFPNNYFLKRVCAAACTGSSCPTEGSMHHSPWAQQPHIFSHFTLVKVV